MVGVGKVTVEDIVKHLGKYVGSVTGNITAAMCKTKAIQANDLTPKTNKEKIFLLDRS